MNRKEHARITHQTATLVALGFTEDEAEKLRRISLTLRRWHELECGIGNGCIERDETTGRTYWHNSYNGKRYATPDRETGALKRLAQIIGQRNGRPGIVAGRLNAAPAGKLSSYVQTDPRGAALYILRPGDVPAGCDANAYYSRGICVY